MNELNENVMILNGNINENELKLLWFMVITSTRYLFIFLFVFYILFFFLLHLRALSYLNKINKMRKIATFNNRVCIGLCFLGVSCVCEIKKSDLNVFLLFILFCIFLFLYDINENELKLL